MNAAQLQAGYQRLKHGNLWSSTGKCKGYAVANPGEAAKIDAYVAALVAGGTPTPPQLATDTGAGIVTMLAALATTADPALHVLIDEGTGKQGGTGTGRIAA